MKRQLLLFAKFIRDREIDYSERDNKWHGLGKNDHFTDDELYGCFISESAPEETNVIDYEKEAEEFYPYTTNPETGAITKEPFDSLRAVHIRARQMSSPDYKPGEKEHLEHKVNYSQHKYNILQKDYFELLERTKGGENKKLDELIELLKRVQGALYSNFDTENGEELRKDIDNQLKTIYELR